MQGHQARRTSAVEAFPIVSKTLPAAPSAAACSGLRKHQEPGAFNASSSPNPQKSFLTAKPNQAQVIGSACRESGAGNKGPEASGVHTRALSAPGGPQCSGKLPLDSLPLASEFVTKVSSGQFHLARGRG